MSCDTNLAAVVSSKALAGGVVIVTQIMLELAGSSIPNDIDS